MRRTIVALLACAAFPGIVRAEPFEEAKVTETINVVSLLQQLQKPQPATVGDVIKGQTALKTGGESRAELKFPDLTMTRVGANSLFRFYAGGRDMTLDGGTMLFYSPKGAGGGKVQAGAVTAAVTGSAVMVMNLSPTIKVVCLEHAAIVSGPGFTRKIRQGQVIDQNGKVTNINIAALARSSNLCSGFSTSLPFVLRDYRKTQIDLDTNVDQTGQVARRTILGNQQNQVNTVQTTPVTTTRRPPLPVAAPTPPSGPPSILPVPTPAPTPKRHRPHRPPRPPQEGPPKGGEGGEVGQPGR